MKNEIEDWELIYVPNNENLKLALVEVLGLPKTTSFISRDEALKLGASDFRLEVNEYGDGTMVATWPQHWFIKDQGLYTLTTIEGGKSILVRTRTDRIHQYQVFDTYDEASSVSSMLVDLQKRLKESKTVIQWLTRQEKFNNELSTWKVTVEV
jgi:hypothetical protein